MCYVYCQVFISGYSLFSLIYSKGYICFCRYIFIYYWKIVRSIVSGLSVVVVVVVVEMSSFSLSLYLDLTSYSLVLVSSFGFESNLISDLVSLDLASSVSSPNDV